VGVSDGFAPKNKTGIQEFELTVRFKLFVYITTDVAKNCPIFLLFLQLQF
jgi:hypothetical protein